MRIFSMDFGDIVIYDEEKLEKGYVEGGCLLQLKKADLEEYLNGNQEFPIWMWLEDNEREYVSWQDASIYEDDFNLEADEILVYDEDLTSPFLPEDIDWWNLLYGHNDGNNWVDLELEDEITEDYGKLEYITTHRGEFEEGNWHKNSFGQWDIYKNGEGFYFIVYSSYFQGELDTIESITERELEEKFGEGWED